MKPKWPDPILVRAWQNRIRKRLRVNGKTQQWLADRAMVTLGALEAWLADPQKTWHQPPSYLQSIGLQELIARKNSIPAIAKKRQERAETLARRRSEWTGRTIREIMAMEGLSQVGVSDYARKNQIAICLDKRGRKPNSTNA